MDRDSSGDGEVKVGGRTEQGVEKGEGKERRWMEMDGAEKGEGKREGKIGDDWRWNGAEDGEGKEKGRSEVVEGGWRMERGMERGREKGREKGILEMDGGGMEQRM